MFIHMTLDEMLAREEIRAVLTRYMHAIDRNDAAALRTCFTDDVHAEYAGGVVAGGIDRMIDFLTGVTVADNARLPEIAQYRQGMHILASVEIQLHGQTASSEAYAIIHHVPAESDVHIERGVRYMDRLRRDDGSWRIYDRKHTLDWAQETVAKYSIEPAQRVYRD